MDKGKGAVLIFRVLCLILIVVFMFSIIKFCFGSSSVSFSGFLNYVSNTPQISVNYEKVFTIFGSWPDGFLWLKPFIEVIANIINISWWIMRNIANLVTVFSYFVFYIFV